jgi:hypothetical protein
VQKLQNVWHLWQTCKALNTRPSEIMGLDDPYLAYCLDEAITFGGRSIEADLESITHKKPKRQAQMRENRLLALLGISQSQMPGRFKSIG